MWDTPHPEAHRHHHWSVYARSSPLRGGACVMCYVCHVGGCVMWRAWSETEHRGRVNQYENRTTQHHTLVTSSPVAIETLNDFVHFVNQAICLCV